MNSIKTIELTINGIKTPVRSSTPVTAQTTEAVLFLHGNPGSYQDWEAFLPQVAEFSRVVAPDMPGYGSAERPSDFDYTVQAYANHLDALLKQLGINQVHLVLHDFGGPWGLQYACDHPDLVKSITLTNVGAAPDYKWHKFAKIWRTPLLGELFQLMSSHWSLRLLLNLDNPKPLPEDFVRRLSDDIDWGLSKGMLKLYRATDLAELTRKLAPSLRKLAIPVLTLWGEGDKYVPVKYAEVQKDYFNTAVHVLPDCGHWPMIDNPELYASYLIPFLKKQCSLTLNNTSEAVRPERETIDAPA